MGRPERIVPLGHSGKGRMAWTEASRTLVTVPMSISGSGEGQGLCVNQVFCAEL